MFSILERFITGSNVMNNFRHIDTINPSGLSAQEEKKRDFVTCHVLELRLSER